LTGANNSNIKIQKCYVDLVRTSSFTTINSDKNVTYEYVQAGSYVEGALDCYAQIDAGLNSIYKGCKTGSATSTGQSSVYGTHFMDMFTGNTTGIFQLALNEPSSETSAQVTAGSGTTLKFNSAGGILLDVPQTSVVFEDSVYRKGHTGFRSASATLVGGVSASYVIQYDITTGSGYSNTWKTTSASNLSAISIDPSVGFKMKVKLNTIASNYVTPTYIKFFTTSSSSAQASGQYPLDTITLTLQGLQPGSDVVIYQAGTSNIRASVDANSTDSWGYVYETAENIDIGIFKATYIPLYIRNYVLTNNNASLPVAQVADRAYLY
jgi:hypothetical protein